MHEAMYVPAIETYIRGARCRFAEETFAGTSANGRVTPIPTVPAAAINSSGFDA